MTCGRTLIDEYCVGSTDPSMNFVWDGEQITGYTFDFVVTFATGRTKTLAVTVEEEGDGVRGSVPAAFRFDIPDATFWDEKGRHKGKMSVTRDGKKGTLAKFIFDVGV